MCFAVLAALRTISLPPLISSSSCGHVEGWQWLREHGCVCVCVCEGDQVIISQEGIGTVMISTSDQCVSFVPYSYRACSMHQHIMNSVCVCVCVCVRLYPWK